jgi:hypothetical protein
LSEIPQVDKTIRAVEDLSQYTSAKQYTDCENVEKK